MLADQRVNILAMALDAGGRLHLILDNHVRGVGVLRGGHHRVTERDVLYIAVPQGPGGLAPVLKMVGDAGVNIDYAYGADAKEGGVAVIGVDNAQRAAAATGL